MTRNQTPDQMPGQVPDQMVDELDRLLDADDARGADTGSDAQLGDLVHLAEGLRDLPTAAPTSEFRDRLRGQLLTEAAAMLPAAQVAPAPAAIGWRERLAHWRRSVSLAVASALSATAIGGAGVAVAAQSALPDDTLYGVKRGIESVRMAVANGDLETGRLHLAFADERLDEVTDGVDDLSPSRLIDTLEEMDEASALGANELLDAYGRSGDTDILRELGGFIDEQRAGLYAISDDLPVEAVPFAERSLELIRRIEVQATELFLGCVDCADEQTTIPRPGEAPARDTETDTGSDAPGNAEEGPQGAEGPEEATDTGTGEFNDPAGELDDPLGELDDPLGELEPSLEPSLGPTLEPSLPTDDVSDPVGGITEPLEDTVGDLLYE